MENNIEGPMPNSIVELRVSSLDLYTSDVSVWKAS